jgi:hypothetical protein
MDSFIYILTVIDEISDEVIVTLLKDKTADTVLAACKRAHLSLQPVPVLLSAPGNSTEDQNSVTASLTNGFTRN